MDRLTLAQSESSKIITPDKIDGLIGWFSAEDALGSTAVNNHSAIGGIIRRVQDRSTLNISLDQATGNAQPLLGYLKPPEGNLINYSDDSSQWTVQQGAVIVGAGPTDPNGTESIEVNLSSGSGVAVGVRKTGNSNVIPLGNRTRCFAWIRTVSGSGNIRFRNFGENSSLIPVTSTWTLASGTITNNGVWTYEGLVIIREDETTPNIYIGRVWQVNEIWSHDYAFTSGSSIIPDTTNLPLALRFDGVNDSLVGTSNIPLSGDAEFTIFSVQQKSNVVDSGASVNIGSTAAAANGMSIGSNVRGGGKIETLWYAGHDYNTTTDDPLTPIIIQVRKSPGAINATTKIFVNGQLASASGVATVPSIVAQPLRLGVNHGGGWFFKGGIAEVLIFNRVLSDVEASRIQRYLHRKYLWDTLKRDFEKYLTLLKKEGTELTLETQKDLFNFAYFLYSEIGRNDFIPMRISQNIGRGTKVLSFHGKEGQLINGATWTPDGITTDRSSSQHISFNDLNLGAAASVIQIGSGSAANTGQFACSYSLQTSNNWQNGSIRTEGRTDGTVRTSAVQTVGVYSLDHGMGQIESSAQFMLASYINFLTTSVVMKARNLVTGAIQSRNQARSEQAINLNQLYLGVRSQPALEVPFSGTHSLVILTTQDLLDQTFLNSLYAKYQDTLGKNMGENLAGNPYPGKTLTYTAGGQWYADDVAIPGETGTTYTVKVTDIGKILRCGVSLPVRAWHPKDVPNVKGAWVAGINAYNSESTKTPATDGQTVIAWDDVVSGIRVRQGAGIQQPLWVEDGIGVGIPCIRFNGTNQGLSNTTINNIDLFNNKYIRGVITSVLDTNRTGGQNWHPVVAYTLTPNYDLAFTVYTRFPTNNFTTEIRAIDRFSPINRINIPSTDGISVISSITNGKTGQLSMQIGNNTTVNTAIPTGKHSATPAVLDFATQHGGYSPIDLTCVIMYAGDNPLSARNLNRLKQYAGLCGGVDLGLDIS